MFEAQTSFNYLPLRVESIQRKDGREPRCLNSVTEGCNGTAQVLRQWCSVLAERRKGILPCFWAGAPPGLSH